MYRSLGPSQADRGVSPIFPGSLVPESGTQGNGAASKTVKHNRVQQSGASGPLEAARLTIGVRIRALSFRSIQGETPDMRPKKDGDGAENVPRTSSSQFRAISAC